MSPCHSDFIVYVDESGDHGMDRIDPGYPVFVLAFCVFAKADCCNIVTRRMTAFKFEIFGHDQVVLHERDIRKRVGPFKILADEERRRVFHAKLGELIGASPFTLIASVIQKDRHAEQYQAPENPYALSLEFALERLAMHINSQANADLTHIIVEARGKKEDAQLELEFRRICDGRNYLGRNLPFEIVFAEKKSNSSGLQLADLVARPIGLSIVRPDQPNRAYEVLRGKFRRSPGGSVSGWGLKCFP